MTESKKSSQALAESEKRYSDLFQLSPLPMFVYEIETLKYLDVNAAAITHYGYSREDFLAMTILDIRPVNDIPLIQNVLLEQQKEHKVKTHGTFRHRKKNGEIIQVDIQSNQIVYKGVKARVVLANDVTERVRYVKAIEAQNKKLLDISWMQSHVIRAPLSRIMGLIPLLSQITEASAEQQTIYDYLVASANELDQVIRSITKATGTIDLDEEDKSM
ncbi:PAS domain S-box protein [Pedobacter boryungensis]|uniref:PAS domain S-box protein n=1 Tax=Pedobacter boryungensis TaxID=869962 RepID=UPI00363A646A